MRSAKEFTMFGQDYRLMQVSAASAFLYMNVDRDPKTELLALIEGAAIKVEGCWVTLDEAAINKHVKDRIGVMQPRFVLKALIKVANDLNFGFLQGRKSFTVPSYLRSNHDYEVRHIEGESPVLGMLVADGKATLKELQEFYSLEDAFRIYDILFVEKLNAADAQHEVFTKAKATKGKHAA